MKIRTLLFLPLVLLAASCGYADNYDFKESFSRTGAFNATGKVSLHNINGNITVETWDKNEIRIEGEKSAKTAEELKLIELTIDLSESHANIVVRLPKRSGGFFGGKSLRGEVSFKLKVPATASLDKIETVNSTVDLAGARGTTEVITVNGQIHARELGGSAHLEAVNGEVDASFAALPAHENVVLKSVNGAIKVTLPADAGFQLHSSVVNGRVHCDFPLQGQSRNGGQRLDGTIGDGRATVSAESVNGGIQIGKR